jgi:hypothetical protein
MNIQGFKHIWTTQKAEITVVLFSVLYLLVASFLVGLRMEHWLLLGIYNVCFFISAKTRKIILAFTIFLVFGIVYDLMKAFPNYQVNQVDIAGLYYFERNVFGLNVNGYLITANEFFLQFHNAFLDVVAGLFYINWMPVPLAFAFYLYLKNKQQFLQFSLTFFFVNLLGFCVYYIHPAAPPWYVQLYGFDLHLGVPGNTAGLARFDNLIGLPVFESIYSRNSNVFAALPSLHSAYPVLVLFYAIKNKLGRINWFLGLFMIGIWFSAVYSGHHYVTDVLSGIFCACVGILIFRKVLLKTKAFQNWVHRYKNLITS